MGLICDPSEYGDDCLQCYPAGQTPEFLLAFISGVKIGEDWFPGLPMPGNGYHVLQQSEAHPCRWNTLVDAPYPGFYRITGVSTQLMIGKVDVEYMFGKSIPGYCHKYFDSFYEEWADNYYYGGHAYVTTCNQIADKVREVTPMFDPDPRLELFVNSGGHVVIRYAGKRDGTNIQIEVDTLI